MPSRESIKEWAANRADIYRLVRIEHFSMAEVARIKKISRERVRQIMVFEDERRKEKNNGNR